MSVKTAEQFFNQGLAALAERRPATAAEFFREAVRLDKLQAHTRRDMRYLSYYGLSLARAHHPTPAAVLACEVAVERDPSRPSLRLNLGRVYLMSGRTGPALACFERGLTLSPGHGLLREELRSCDRRERPVVSRLSRSHPINRVAGRLRSAMKNRSVSAEPVC